MLRKGSVLGYALGLLSTAGCTGLLSGSSDSNRGLGGGFGPPASAAGGSSGPSADNSVQNLDLSQPPPIDCTKPDIGESPLRRITTTQYLHSVQALLGIDALPANSLPDDERLGTFRSNLSAPVGDLDVEEYVTLAGDLATSAVSNVDGLVGCDRVAQGDGACATSFIQSFGRRAFRRPLGSDEAQAYQDLYTKYSDVGFSNGIRLVLSAMLSSPSFLYQVEPSTGTSVAKLDGFELAARLAFFLWDGAPDDALLDAAGRGDLDGDSGLTTQVSRMLGDARAADAAG